MLTTLAFVQWREAAPFLFLFALAGYFIGSIPFGVLFAKAAGAGDPRGIGSGSIGATNVLRTGKKWAAAATLVFDMGKGAAAVLLVRWYAGEVFAVSAALGAFLGHLFPIWLGFRGGKGVATFVGITLGLFWPVGVLVCASWLTTALVFRMSSLASLVATGMTPIFFVFWYDLDFLHAEQEMLLFALLEFVLAALVFLTHRGNIVRLIAGREPTIGAR